MDFISLIEPYGGEFTADALLLLKEEERHSAAEPDCPPAKRPRTDSHDQADTVALSFTMPTHRAVLWPLSDYFASKFRSWSCNDSKPQITLLVPAGQLEVGKALVTAIYDRIPADLSQQQLLQLLALADSYRINRISAAVANVIGSIRLDQLEWETVLAIQQLPNAEPLYQPLRAAAKKRCMQLLGDLEMVWALEGVEQRQLLQEQFQPGAAAAQARAHAYLTNASSGARRYINQQGHAIVAWGSSIVAWGPSTELEAAVQAVEEAAAIAAHHPVLPHGLLLQLPFDSLVELLESKELKAESENTVHYTITRWLEQHPEVTSTEQLQRLASLVHLSHCTPGYLSMCVSAEDSWLLPMLSPQQLLHATLASIHGRGPGMCLLYDYIYSAHSRHQRQSSALQQVSMTWDAPLSDLQQSWEQSFIGDNWSFVCSESSIFRWQGLEFYMSVGIEYSRCHVEGGPRRHQIHTLYADIMVGDNAAGFTSKITVWKVSEAEPDEDVAEPEPYLQWETKVSQEKLSSKEYLLIDRGYQEREPFSEDSAVDVEEMSWEQMVGFLRERGLLFDDDCLHLSAEISAVV